MASKTVNRGHLLKAAKAGKLVCVGSREFCDMHGESTTNTPKPVHVMAGHGDHKEGHFNVFEFDFKTKSGCAYEGGDGVICLIVHSNCSYELKKVS
jgi:hypothetical protein